LFFIITAVCTIAFNDGNSIEHWSFKLFLLMMSYVFFDWFWRHGGQTLGMRAWRIQLVAIDNQKIDRKHTLLRFVSGCFTFGFTLIFMLFNDRQQALHDWLSKTNIIKYNN